jgi:class 3 adenylate cyclase
MIEAMRRYGGYIVQSTGDGIFALFGVPVAHEDHFRCRPFDIDLHDSATCPSAHAGRRHSEGASEMTLAVRTYSPARRRG